LKGLSLRQFDFSGKHAVITGGNSGIGNSIARTLAENGACVHILDLVEEQGKSVIQAFEAEKYKATFHICDVSKQKNVMTVFQIIAKDHPIDILVNNAGIANIGNAENTSEEDFDQVYSVNVKGIYNCLHACIPIMKSNGGGVILNLASIAASVGLPDRFAYSMSKGAVVSMTLSVAKDYLSDNIRCNSISPARIHTPFVDGFLKKNYPGKEEEMFKKLEKTQPIGRMGRPEEVASLALFLCSDEAAFITGVDYPIDGGSINLNT
tara:strand:+ start:887 stop:1681 length:795 start_codon:yes stop_codon:yes gene_type:complete